MFAHGNRKQLKLKFNLTVTQMWIFAKYHFSTPTANWYFIVFSFSSKNTLLEIWVLFLLPTHLLVCGALGLSCWNASTRIYLETSSHQHELSAIHFNPFRLHAAMSCLFQKYSIPEIGYVFMCIVYAMYRVHQKQVTTSFFWINFVWSRECAGDKLTMIGR